jgi:hypothetical protein
MGKSIWISAAAAVGLGCGAALIATPASAHDSVYVAPPPAYYYSPPPQAVWVPGHWEWDGNRHVWVHGQYWRGGGDRWAHRDGGSRRDRDHDGIQNRYYRDRDGDGVPNWRDRAPNNRYRR